MLFNLAFIAFQGRMGNMACQSNNPLRLTAERSLKLKIKKRTTFTLVVQN